jgi:hypothetical protein
LGITALRLPRLVSGKPCVTELAELEGETLIIVLACLVPPVTPRRKAKYIYCSLLGTHVLRLVESAIEHAAENVTACSLLGRKESQDDHLQRESSSEPYAPARSQLRAYGNTPSGSRRLSA